MVSTHFLSITLLLGQALAARYGPNSVDTVTTTKSDFWRFRPAPSVSTSSIVLNPVLNPLMKRTIETPTVEVINPTDILATSISRVTVSSVAMVTVYAATVTATVVAPCPTQAYRLLASGSDDSAIDGKFAQLQPAFGSGYKVQLTANYQNAQEFRLGGASCNTLFTSDNSVQAMVGGSANLHYVYFFPSVQAATALHNVIWDDLVCAKNADDTLSCSGMQQSSLQATPDDTLLELGDQNYGEEVSLNLIPV